VPDPSPFASWPMMESVAERVGFDLIYQIFDYVIFFDEALI
jgi:hypothetical protein